MLMKRAKPVAFWLKIVALVVCATFSQAACGKIAEWNWAVFHPGGGGLVKSVRHISTGAKQDREYLNAIEWHPSSQMFAAHSYYGRMVKVYNISDGSLVANLESKGPDSQKCNKNKTSYENHVAFSPDGKRLALGKSVISLWDTGSWTWIRDIEGPYSRGECAADGIKAMGFDPDSNLIAVFYQWAYSASDLPDAVRLDDSYTLDRLHMDFMNNAKNTKIGEKVVGASPRPMLYYFDAESGKEMGHTNFRPLAIEKLSFDPKNEKFIFTSHTLKRSDMLMLSDIQVFFNSGSVNAKTGELSLPINMVKIKGGNLLAFSADNKMVATSSLLPFFKQGRNSPTDPGISAYNGFQDSVGIWDAMSGTMLRELGPLPKEARHRSFSFSPDGRYLAVCQIDYTKYLTILLWNVATGALLDRVTTSAEGAESSYCYFSPDSRHIAIPAKHTIHIIDLKDQMMPLKASRQECQELQGGPSGTSQVNSPGISLDDRLGRALAAKNDAEMDCLAEEVLKNIDSVNWLSMYVASIRMIGRERYSDALFLSWVADILSTAEFHAFPPTDLSGAPAARDSLRFMLMQILAPAYWDGISVQTAYDQLNDWNKAYSPEFKPSWEFPQSNLNINDLVRQGKDKKLAILKPALDLFTDNRYITAIKDIHTYNRMKKEDQTPEAIAVYERAVATVGEIEAAAGVDFMTSSLSKSSMGAK